MQNKYEILGIVGEGAYGIVYKCRNKYTNEIVAIKKFKEIHDDIVKKTMKRELKVLQKLKHENIVEFKEAFKNKSKLYLVFEYVEKNLLEVLEQYPNGLDQKIIKILIFQLCKAVNYLHKNNIIHRDIKPENLLISKDFNLKVCDFGFARNFSCNSSSYNLNNNSENDLKLTEYVATRWYRAPELLIDNGKYGPEIDYWAIGCLMGELIDGNPLFPGENELDQIHCIQKILGNFNKKLNDIFYQNPIFYGKSLLNVIKPQTLEKRYLGKMSKIGIDFLKGLLEIDPNKRLKSEMLFNHPYFKELIIKEQNLDYSSNENKHCRNILTQREKKSFTNFDKNENVVLNSTKNSNVASIICRKNINKEENKFPINMNSSISNKNSTNTNLINNTNEINVKKVDSNNKKIFSKKLLAIKSIQKLNKNFSDTNLLLNHKNKLNNNISELNTNREIIIKKINNSLNKNKTNLTPEKLNKYISNKLKTKFNLSENYNTLMKKKKIIKEFSLTMKYNKHFFNNNNELNDKSNLQINNFNVFQKYDKNLYKNYHNNIYNYNINTNFCNYNINNNYYKKLKKNFSHNNVVKEINKKIESQKNYEKNFENFLKITKQHRKKKGKFLSQDKIFNLINKNYNNYNPTTNINLINNKNYINELNLNNTINENNNLNLPNLNIKNIYNNNINKNYKY